MAVFFQSFARHFSMYNLTAALGLCAALVFSLRRLSANGFDGAALRRIAAAAIAAFLAGAAASNIFNWIVFPELTTLPLLARIRAAGMTFYPGMICAIALFALLLRLLAQPVRRVFFLTVPAFPLFHGIARIGCLFAGCCYGRELTAGAFSFRFPYPALESVFLFALVFLLIRRRPARPLLVYCTAYPIFRFFAEFLRGDDRGVLIPGISLSVSQQISLAILAGVLVYTAISYIQAHLHCHRKGR